MMKNKLILLFALGLCAQVQAQVPHLSRETYRERVEAYSQVLKQQHLKSMASTDARKIAFTGFLPKVDISAEGTLNLKEMDSWDGPAGQYRNHTYQGIFVVSLYRRCPAGPEPHSQSRRKTRPAERRTDT